MKDPLELESRRRIHAYIVDHPGAYLREIQRGVGYEVGTLQYHLDYLEQAGLVVSETKEQRRRFFPRALPPEDRALLGLLRQRAPRRMAIQVLLSEGARFEDLRAAAGVSKATASFHLAKLLRAGVVIGERTGRDTHYWAADAERVARLLIAYRASFLDDAVDRFADVWLEERP